MTVCRVLQVFQIRAEKRAQIPAATHLDGSARPQTFYHHTNSRYHHVIERFRDLTDAPMVLNTSFNENESVVCRPEEALDCSEYQVGCAGDRGRCHGASMSEFATAEWFRGLAVYSTETQGI